MVEVIPDQLEIHVSHACNLSCESCSHYSQLHFKGNLSLETAEQWYGMWSSRLNPRRVSLLGGEPALNPLLTQHITLARRYWNDSEIRLTTNGLLLERHPCLPVELSKCHKHLLQVSRHYSGGTFDGQFDSIIRLCERWKQIYGLNYIISDAFGKWTRRYFLLDGKLTPFNDGNPAESWRICKCRKCTQLFDGKLWKCPIVAYFAMASGKTNAGCEWDVMRKYKPLSHDCTDEQFNLFFQLKEESVCALCPSTPLHFNKPDPRKHEH